MLIPVLMRRKPMRRGVHGKMRHHGKAVGCRSVLRCRRTASKPALTGSGRWRPCAPTTATVNICREALDRHLPQAGERTALAFHRQELAERPAMPSGHQLRRTGRPEHAIRPCPAEASASQGRRGIRAVAAHSRTVRRRARHPAAGRGVLAAVFRVRAGTDRRAHDQRRSARAVFAGVALAAQDRTGAGIANLPAARDPDR